MLFIFLAKEYYKEAARTIQEKTLIIAYNLGVLPILYANIYALGYIFDNGTYSDAILIYLIPIIYSPIVFVISLGLVYLILLLVNKIFNKYKETQ